MLLIPPRFFSYFSGGRGSEQGQIQLATSNKGQGATETEEKSQMANGRFFFVFFFGGYRVDQEANARLHLE